MEGRKGKGGWRREEGVEQTTEKNWNTNTK